MKRYLSSFFSIDVARRARMVGDMPTRNPFITGLVYDSRDVLPENCYFALQGLHVDGHNFVEDALDRGASLIVHQTELPLNIRERVTCIQVEDSRLAMSPIADAFYDSPSKRLTVIGVTGTEGKSTTVYLIFQLLRLMGKRAGFISTVQYSYGGAEQWNPQHQTTPEATEVQRILARIRDEGVKYAIIEASSHGLSERTNRLGNVLFDVGVMTNVTYEHLEFHGTWEQYRFDKANLFRALDENEAALAWAETTLLRSQIPLARAQSVWSLARNALDQAHLALPLEDDSMSQASKALLGALGPFVRTGEALARAGDAFVRADPRKHFGVANADDKSASYFAGATRRRTFFFSVLGADADLSVKKIESHANGNRYEVFIRETGQSVVINDRLPGAFNVGNTLAAILVVSRLLEVPVVAVAKLVRYCNPVKGRMTPVCKGQLFEVVVDYAHTPASFATILPPLRERLDASGGGAIITLFGSGGERDTNKRSEQGRIAALWSDIIILTDEDPRGEVSMAILEDIARGIPMGKRGEDLFLISYRPAAIRKAFSLAKAGDMVLLLGKGHENSIIYADGPIPYDEFAEAEEALKELGF
jgi:UDP-N-acetylmuramoyl-L-alanyl-D-glutamate--2,6-diaminopimelate ligase